MNNFLSYRAHKMKLLKNCNKSAILNFFEATIKNRELAISNIPNKFEEDTWKTFEVISPTGT